MWFEKYLGGSVYMLNHMKLLQSNGLHVEIPENYFKILEEGFFTRKKSRIFKKFPGIFTCNQSNMGLIRDSYLIRESNLIRNVQHSVLTNRNRTVR